MTARSFVRAAGAALLIAATTAQAGFIATHRGAGGDYLSGNNTPHAVYGSTQLQLDAYGYTRQNVQDSTVAAADLRVTGGTPAENQGTGVRHPGDTNTGQIDNTGETAEWIALDATSLDIRGVALSLFNNNDQVRIIGSTNQQFLSGAWTDLITPIPVTGDNSTNPTDLFFDVGTWNYVNVFVGEGGVFCDQNDTSQCNDRLRLHGVHIPEPAPFALIALAILGLVTRRR